MRKEKIDPSVFRREESLSLHVYFKVVITTNIFEDSLISHQTYTNILQAHGHSKLPTNKHNDGKRTALWRVVGKNYHRFRLAKIQMKHHQLLLYYEQIFQPTYLFESSTRPKEVWNTFPTKICFLTYKDLNAPTIKVHAEASYHNIIIKQL